MKVTAAHPSSWWETIALAPAHPYTFIPSVIFTPAPEACLPAPSPVRWGAVLGAGPAMLFYGESEAGKFDWWAPGDGWCWQMSAPGDRQVETQVWAGKPCTPKSDAQCSGQRSVTCVLKGARAAWDSPGPGSAGSCSMAWHNSLGPRPVHRALSWGSCFHQAHLLFCCLSGAWVWAKWEKQDQRVVGTSFLQEFSLCLAMQNNQRV